MVKIPYIKIPSVRVGSIVPTSNIGTGGATPAPPTPITYLTQWKIVGNSEVHTDSYLTQWKVEGNSVVDNPSANLPQGYKKCKYLEFHGTEYINSGVPLKNNIGISLDLSTTVTAKTTIGARNNSLNGVLFGYHFPLTQDENYRMYFAYGSSSTNYRVQTNVCDGLLHHIVLDSQQAKIDNESVVIDRGNEFPQLSVYIGTWNNYNGTPDDRMFVGKIYSVTLYDNNGHLFNGIPCLDNNDVPCLYDTVSNTAFYNDGTGTFGYEIEQPAILSCGDLGQDGKYHVKISNGVTIYDIPLTEPLRKVNDVADSIEFVNGVATLTRKIVSVDMSALNWLASQYSSTGKYRYNVYSLQNIIKKSVNNNTPGDILCAVYNTTTANGVYSANLEGIAVDSAYGSVYLYDANYDQADDLDAFLEHIQGAEMLYALATPTTETIQVSPFPVSPTDTYTSANDTPYSAFEYKKNVEIWSCGEYSATDGKYHIVVLPLGKSPVDIALDEPLRKVNDVADTIEYADDVATLTRNLASDDMGDLTYTPRPDQKDGFFIISLPNRKYYQASGVLCTIYTQISSIGAIASAVQNLHDKECCYFFLTNNYNFVDRLFAYDTDYIGATEAQIKAGLSGQKIIYELATPTTETIQAPQIQEAESYSCVISQGGKAVSWSSFETE